MITCEPHPACQAAWQVSLAAVDFRQIAIPRITFLAINKVCVGVRSVFDANEQDVPSDCTLEFGKTSKRTWEEHLWGRKGELNMIISL